LTVRQCADRHGPQGQIVAIERIGLMAMGEACEALAAEGAVVFAQASKLGLEGIMSKRAGSFYKGGRSRNRLKTKNPDFVWT